MENFTPTQARACTFKRCESFKIDGVHQYWIIAVTDEDGLYYEWNDKSLPGTANINAVKAASLTTLTGMQKQTPAPVKTTDELDGIIGTTVGE
jgi:hypothetical protein